MAIDSYAAIQGPKAPAMAKRRFCSVVVVSAIVLLRRSISWRRCTVNGCAGPPGSLRSLSRTSSRSNAGGACIRMHAAATCLLITTAQQANSHYPGLQQGDVMFLVCSQTCATLRDILVPQKTSQMLLT